jgi:hypothetical protein
MPGMCLALVAVAAMLVVWGGSATATVEEAAMAAAEEADETDNGPQVCTYSVTHDKIWRGGCCCLLLPRWSPRRLPTSVLGPLACIA